MATCYVQRGAGGAIVGVFANPQPGFAEETLLADDAEVTSYLAPRPVQPTPLDWFLRLPQETQAALDVAARTDTAVSLALRYASGVISVDVKDPRTIANVGLLFTKGLLTAAERDSLLAP